MKDHTAQGGETVSESWHTFDPDKRRSGSGKSTLGTQIPRGNPATERLL